MDALIAALLKKKKKTTDYTEEQPTEDFGSNACELVKAVAKSEATETLLMQ